jgi:8-oxo-dGTP diphosphatase
MGVHHMEIWDLYDEHKNKIGKTHVRGVPLPEGCYHLVVHIWIQNDKGEVLLSRRHPQKTWGNFWECTGGSVLTGETSLEGALRETTEELGLVLDPNKGKLVMSELRKNFHSDMWLFYANAAIEDLVFQDDEVIDAKWVDQETYENMLRNQEIVPTLPHFWNAVLRQ